MGFSAPKHFFLLACFLPLYFRISSLLKPTVHFFSVLQSRTFLLSLFQGPFSLKTFVSTGHSVLYGSKLLILMFMLLYEMSDHWLKQQMPITGGLRS